MELKEGSQSKMVSESGEDRFSESAYNFDSLSLLDEESEGIEKEPATQENI